MMPPKFDILSNTSDSPNASLRFLFPRRIIISHPFLPSKRRDNRRRRGEKVLNEMVGLSLNLQRKKSLSVVVVVGNKFNTGEILAYWHQRACRRPCIFLFYCTAGDRERDKRLERWNLELFGRLYQGMPRC